MTAIAKRPGAINVLVGDLSLDDILALVTPGSTETQTTIRQLALLIGASTLVGIRVEDSGGTLNMTAADYLLAVDTTAGGNTTVNLEASPPDGRPCIIKDAGGQLNIGVQTITLVGPINGQSSLVMQAAWQSVSLIYSEDLAVWLTT